MARIGKCKKCGGELIGTGIWWNAVVETTCKKCGKVTEIKRTIIVDKNNEGHSVI